MFDITFQLSPYPFIPSSGFDIKENFLNVLRLMKFQDTNLWVNVQEQVKFKAVDLSKYDYEVYLYERPLYNRPKLYLAIVMERKGQRVLEYIRKFGSYWTGLSQNYQNQNHLLSINGEEKYSLDFEVVGETNPVKLVYSKVYSFQNLTGGACPEKGGDLGRYPWGDAGGGWPVNYQEVTPLCNGLALDVKFWNNLFLEKDWTDPRFNLANAPYKGETVVEYMVDANLYGDFTDDYLKKERKENPYILKLTKDGKTVANKASAEKPVTIRLEFATTSYPNDFYDVPELGLSKAYTLQDYCPKRCAGSKDEKESTPSMSKLMELIKIANALK